MLNILLGLFPDQTDTVPGNPTSNRDEYNSQSTSISNVKFLLTLPWIEPKIVLNLFPNPANTVPSYLTSD